MSRTIKVNSSRVQGNPSLDVKQLRNGVLGYLAATLAKAYGQGDGPEPTRVDVDWDIRHGSDWYLEHVGTTGLETTCLLAREVSLAEDTREIEAIAVQVGLTPRGSYLIEPHTVQTEGVREGDDDVKLYSFMLGAIQRRWSDQLVVD